LSSNTSLSARIAALKSEIDRITDTSSRGSRFGFGSSTESDLRRLVDQLSSEVADYVGTTQEKVSAFASDTQNKAERSIRSQPLAAVAACFVAGVLVGRLWAWR